MNIKIRPSHDLAFAEITSLLLSVLLLSFLVAYLTFVRSVWAIPVSIFFPLMLIVTYCWLSSVSYVWHISDEGITENRGVFFRTSNHIEFYRVIDYQEHQTLLQLLFGIKSITLVTTDKLNATMLIRDISSSLPLMLLIRHRVDVCKTQKQTYEVINH